jgi:hypothetical protein
MSQSFGNNITIDDYSYNASLVSALVAGDYVRIESTAEPTQFMAGTIVQWGGTGTDMIVSIEYISSGNEYYEWLIKLGVKIGANSITNLELADNSVTETKILDGSITEAKFSSELQTNLGEFTNRLLALEIGITKPHGIFEIANDPDSGAEFFVTMYYYDAGEDANVYLFQGEQVGVGEIKYIPYKLPNHFAVTEFTLYVDGDGLDLISYTLPKSPGHENGIVNDSQDQNSIFFGILRNYHHYIIIFLTLDTDES